jgi:hypothetical protein
MYLLDEVSKMVGVNVEAVWSDVHAKMMVLIAKEDSMTSSTSLTAIVYCGSDNMGSSSKLTHAPGDSGLIIHSHPFAQKFRAAVKAFLSTYQSMPIVTPTQSAAHSLAVQGVVSTDLAEPLQQESSSEVQECDVLDMLGSGSTSSNTSNAADACPRTPAAVLSAAVTAVLPAAESAVLPAAESAVLPAAERAALTERAAASPERAAALAAAQAAADDAGALSFAEGVIAAAAAHTKKACTNIKAARCVLQLLHMQRQLTAAGFAAALETAATANGWSATNGTKVKHSKYISSSVYTNRTLTLKALRDAANHDGELEQFTAQHKAACVAVTTDVAATEAAAAAAAAERAALTAAAAASPERAAALAAALATAVDAGALSFAEGVMEAAAAHTKKACTNVAAVRCVLQLLHMQRQHTAAGFAVALETAATANGWSATNGGSRHNKYLCRSVYSSSAAALKALRNAADYNGELEQFTAQHKAVCVAVTTDVAATSPERAAASPEREAALAAVQYLVATTAAADPDVDLPSGANDNAEKVHTDYTTAQLAAGRTMRAYAHSSQCWPAQSEGKQYAAVYLGVAASAAVQAGVLARAPDGTTVISVAAWASVGAIRPLMQHYRAALNRGIKLYILIGYMEGVLLPPGTMLANHTQFKVVALLRAVFSDCANFKCIIVNHHMRHC